MAQVPPDEECIDFHVKIMKRKEFDISISPKSTVAEVFTKIGEHFEDPIERLCFKGRFFRSPKDDSKTFLKGFKTASSSTSPTSPKPPKASTIVGYPKKGVKQAEDNNNNNNSNSNSNSNIVLSLTSNKNKNNNDNSNSNEDSKNDVDAVINRQKSLKEIQEAAMKLAKRADDGFDWNSQYYLELSDQYGNPIRMPEEARQALTVALTLQQKAEKFLKTKSYEDALFLYHLAFESYSKVEQKWLDAVDNYGLCCLNIVWIYYLNKDDKHMHEAGQWLRIAEVGLERANGKNKEKLIARNKGGFLPQLAFYVRLNILRTMQSLYKNEINKAQNYLDLAKMDSRKLEISDVSIAQMQSMGFDFQESRRALRATQCDIMQACNYIEEKRREKARLEAQEEERLRQRREQKKYGLTKSGKFVDLILLQQLKSMGISNILAVEALKQVDNSRTALDIVLDPFKKEALQSTIYTRAMRKQAQYKIDQLLELSPDKDEAKCRSALLLSWDKMDGAINTLLQQPPSDSFTQSWAIFIGLVAEKNARLERERKAREQRELEQAMLQSANNNNNSNDNDIDLTTNANANDDNNNNNNSNENDTDNDIVMSNNNNNNNSIEDEKQNTIVESAIDVDGDVSAFPNPHLGDTGDNDNIDGNGDINLDDIELVDDFKDIERNTMDDDDNAQINEKILDDFEEDPDAYLDLDLADEIEAIASLETMIASVRAASMS